MPKKAAPRSGRAKPAPSKAPKAPKGRNRFGDPADTLYAGGTPLFDETGRAGPKKAPARKSPRSR
jgi:hypothetical protein